MTSTSITTNEFRVDSLSNTNASTAPVPSNEHRIVYLNKSKDPNFDNNNNNGIDNDENDSCEINDENDNHRTVAEVLVPPITKQEAFRDILLRFVDHPTMQIIGVIVLVLVIADGAFFFFLLMGWHTLCSPKTDCNPRNWWYNFSIQLLNVLFTYMSTVSMPWRCTNLLHTIGWNVPKRSNAIGCNLYGLPAHDDIWFYIPLRQRTGILLILLGNAIFQFVNQATRIRFHSFEAQNVPPGNIWTNVFFASSFLCGGIAAAWLLYESGKVRRQYPPNTFHPGPIDAMKELFSKKTNTTTNKSNNNLESVDDTKRNNPGVSPSTTEGVWNDSAIQHDKLNLNQSQLPSSQLTVFQPAVFADPTREVLRRNMSGQNRSFMKLFGM